MPPLRIVSSYLQGHRVGLRQCRIAGFATRCTANIAEFGPGALFASDYRCRGIGERPFEDWRCNRDSTTTRNPWPAFD